MDILLFNAFGPVTTPSVRSGLLKAIFVNWNAVKALYFI